MHWMNESKKCIKISLSPFTSVVNFLTNFFHTSETILKKKIYVWLMDRVMHSINFNDFLIFYYYYFAGGKETHVFTHLQPMNECHRPTHKWFTKCAANVCTMKM